MDKYLVEYCSPTLASLKTASLFCYAYSSDEELDEYIAVWNDRMRAKGIRICILRKRSKRALIYVYRRRYLAEDLKRQGVFEFLKKEGYDSVNPESAIAYLRKRLSECDGFPHEIGLFLGYPLGDVVGFVENSGRNCICCGCWKVYCNEKEAIRTFQKFRKCTMVYTRLWSQGIRSIMQLTVAA